MIPFLDRWYIIRSEGKEKDRYWGEKRPWKAHKHMKMWIMIVSCQTNLPPSYICALFYFLHCRYHFREISYSFVHPFINSGKEGIGFILSLFPDPRTPPQEILHRYFSVKVLWCDPTWFFLPLFFLLIVYNELTTFNVRKNPKKRDKNKHLSCHHQYHHHHLCQCHRIFDLGCWPQKDLAARR